MTIRPAGAGLLHPDGRTDERTDRPTDMAKLSRFSQICEGAYKRRPPNINQSDKSIPLNTGTADTMTVSAAWFYFC